MRPLSLLSVISLVASVLAHPVPHPKLGAAAYTHLIIHDISNINSAVKSLTKAIKAYHGGAAQAAPLSAGVLAIHAVNRKAYVDAIPPVHANDAESRKITLFTRRSVGRSIPASVKALEAKKQDLEAAGAAGFVVPGLKLLKRDHDSYSAELLKKVAPDWLVRAEAVVKEIRDAIQGGIDVFESS